MRIERHERAPEPPPPEFVMTFERHEGWTIVAALHEYAERYPVAAHAMIWHSWARDLDTKLRVA